MPRIAGFLFVLSLSLAGPAWSDEVKPVKAVRSASLFERVCDVLAKRFHDKEFRKNELPALVERFTPLAEKAETLAEQRAVTHLLLAEVPASHLGLLSETGMDFAMRELRGAPSPMFGFELINHDGKLFAHQVLDGGPAAQAGLLRGDRVVSIDGVPTENSPLLDWRTDDAYLPDPAIHPVFCDGEDAVIKLQVERKPREFVEVEIPAEVYSAIQSTRDGARVVERDGYKLGYIHLWYIHMSGVHQLVEEQIEDQFGECDALLLDLRGRGGNGMAIAALLNLFRGEEPTWRKPVVAIINNLTRSAKEVIAYELSQQNLALLVGEPTAGAVIPATFAKVGHDTVLMFPSFRLGDYTKKIEGQPVQPDVRVKDAGPYSAGDEPLITAAAREAVRLIREANGEPVAR